MDLRPDFLPPETASTAASQGGLQRGSGLFPHMAHGLVSCSPSGTSSPLTHLLPLTLGTRRALLKPWVRVRLQGLLCFFTVTFRISPLGDSFPFLCCSFPLCWRLGCGQNIAIQARTFSLKDGKVHLAETKLLGRRGSAQRQVLAGARQQTETEEAVFLSTWWVILSFN